jgi:hypothetical protein
MNARHIYLSAGTMLAAVLLVSGTGCSMFQERLKPKLTAEVTPADGDKPTVEPNKYTVEIRPHKGQPQARQFEFTEPLHVQQALKQSKADKKYGRFFLDLYRPLPDGRWHKMNLEYDRAEDSVPPEFDYAILPGDRLIVTEDNTTVLDDVLDAATMPFGGKRDTGPTKNGRYRIEG